MGKDEEKGFFACYLLCSLSPRHKGHTYIGFTVKPQRRIRQHNGEIQCGAWRTKRKRPWEMILCIYGFPSNVSALQFEWAWQHPRESLAVRQAASSFKSLSGVANKIKLAYTMLTLPAWQNLNLTVNFFSTMYTKHMAGCPKLPEQMNVQVCSMDELPCYLGDLVLADESDEEDRNDDDRYAKESVDMSTIDGKDTGYDMEGKLCTVDGDCGKPYLDIAINGEQEISCSLGKETRDLFPEMNRYDFVQPTEPLTTREKYSKIISQRVEESNDNCSPEQRVKQRRSLSLQFRNISSESLEEGDSEKLITPLTPRESESTPSFMIQSTSSTKDNNTVQGTPISLLSPEPTVTDLQSPSSCCIIRFTSNRSSVDPKVIDLTDSPVVIQL